MIKYVVFFIFLVFFVPFAMCKPINFTAYINMKVQSYRHNYQNNIHNQVMPYWQAQSNFGSRNRVYQDYSSYDNALQQYNNAHQQYRSYI